MKQNTHVYLDFDVYSKAKIEGVNISATVNQLLKSYLEVDDDVQEVMESEIEEQKLKIKKEQEKLHELSAKKLKWQEDNDKKAAQRLEDLRAMNRAIINSGMLGDD